jgi:hypothetical protein
MKKHLSKRRVIVAAFVVLALAIASSVAYAYFTSTGSGSGSAAVGTAGNNLVVTGTPDATALTPGGPGSVISFTVQNPSNFNQKISSIHLASITPDGVHGSCATVLGTDFSMGNVGVGAGGNIAPNAAAQALTETGTLNMLDSGISQNACQGATLTLTFSTT